MSTLLLPFLLYYEHGRCRKHLLSGKHGRREKEKKDGLDTRFATPGGVWASEAFLSCASIAVMS
jgi:hypothetical protein